MILEILDYLWIKSFLLGSDVEDFKKCVTEQGKEFYEEFIYSLADLMENEYFLLINSNLVPKMLSMVNAFRFEYNKDKKLNDRINDIIDMSNKYKSISDKRYRELVTDYYRNEAVMRRLPFGYAIDIKFLNNCMLFDYSNFTTIYVKKDNEEADEKKPIINDIMGFISTANYLINKYPEFFKEDIAMDNLCYYLTAVTVLVAENTEISDKTAKVYFKYINRTIKRLNKLKKEFEREEKVKGLEFIQI